MKNTNYAIIDHIGSLESNDVMKACYKLAYDLSNKKATYTMKGFCQKISRNPNTKVSDKQKNFVRFNKHPEEVVLICNEFNTKAQWLADVWAEKVDKLTIIEATTMEVYTLEDIHPEWFHLNCTDSIYRRCANIWSKALGWQFSAPLYIDRDVNTSESFIRNQLTLQQFAKSYIDYECPNHDTPVLRYTDKEQKDLSKFSKVATNPNSYLKTKAVASEDECKQFFEHYKWLQQNGLLADSLEAGYQLCPHCGRPIAIDKAEVNLNEVDPALFKDASKFHARKDDRTCSHCQLLVPAELLNNFTTYYDDSCKEEDWG